MSVNVLRYAEGWQSEPVEPDPFKPSKFAVESAGCELGIRMSDQGPPFLAAFEYPDGEPAPQICAEQNDFALSRPRVETRMPFIVRTHRWRADVSLHRDRAWWLRIEGDANHAMLALGDARLSMMEIVGASNSVQVILPRPVGQMSIVIYGGGNTVNLIAPASVHAAIRISGAGSRLRVDSLRIPGAMDQLSWRDRQYMESANRIHVHVTGAASAINLIRRH